ncbi:hypothetical protein CAUPRSCDRAFT_11163 [Caulochytrium protostelioides]|nr:hypothetical protein CAUPRSCDRAFT_11163 [Caulochytrium protostelioides]
MAETATADASTTGAHDGHDALLAFYQQAMKATSLWIDAAIASSPGHIGVAAPADTEAVKRPNNASHDGIDEPRETGHSKTRSAATTAATAEVIEPLPISSEPDASQHPMHDALDDMDELDALLDGTPLPAARPAVALDPAEPVFATAALSSLTPPPSDVVPAVDASAADASLDDLLALL